MRPERYSYSYGHRAGISKSLRSRALVVLMALAAVALLVMARGGNVSVEHLRTEMNAWLAPVMKTVTMPVRGVRNLMADKAALFNAYEENKQLHAENETLKHWQAVAQSLKAENESLRQIANYRPVGGVDYVTAQVIAQSPDAYAGTLTIDAGSDQGLHSLLPVIDSEGLVGRLVEVGDSASRVLLLSDAMSRVPVVTAKSRVQAVLAGTGEELLRMTFISGDAKNIELGEAVMTTSQGGLIPESVMIGTVFKRDSNGTLLVKPVRPLAQSEYVRVMVGK